MNTMQDVIRDIIGRFNRLDERLNRLETYEQAIPTGATYAGAHVYKNAWQSGVTGGWHGITFQSELWDTDSFFTPGTSWFTAPMDGRYYVHGHLTLDWAAAPSQYDLRLLIGGTYWNVKTWQPNNEAPSVFSRWPDIMCIANLAAGQTVSFDINVSGGSLDIIEAGDAYDSYFEIELLATT